MLSPRQQLCLKGIGIQQWVGRSSDDAAREPVEAPVVIEAIAQQVVQKIKTEAPIVHLPTPPNLDTWDSLRHSIHQCEACELSANCTQKVPGVGNQRAELMIIGEGPGHEEDLKGEPFVGRSGQLLDRMLLAIGLSR